MSLIERKMKNMNSNKRITCKQSLSEVIILTAFRIES